MAPLPLSRTSKIVAIIVLLAGLLLFRIRPSTMSLSQEQKAQLHEVADLLLDIYNTLAHMRYLDPAGIEPGPHQIDQQQLDELGLDPAIRYLYSILPYVDIEQAGNSDFLLGGSFADFRVPNDVKEGRDPFSLDPQGDDFEAEDGPYMRPWVTPLTALGNHQSVIIYDARKHRIWIIDQEGWDSADLELKDVPTPEAVGANSNSFEHIPSRPTSEVLRSIKDWYRTLKVVPGGERSDGKWAIELEPIYRKAGWPDHFDGDAFEILQVRAYGASRAVYMAEQPLRAVEKFQAWSQASARNVALLEEDIESAKTSDEKWVARFKIWNTKKIAQKIKEELRDAEEEAARLCPAGVCQRPEDLPLWELEMVRREYESKQGSVERYEEWAEDSKDDPGRMQKFINRQRRLEREIEIYRQAYEASKADAERECPGETFHSATGINPPGSDDANEDIQNRKDRISSLEKEVATFEGWGEQLPNSEGKATGMVQHEIHQLKKRIKWEQDTLTRVEAYHFAQKEKNQPEQAN
ncbi:hypothetical protein BX600DRAFT_445066 [Xylariales sp. PMI_506]|nr:hypothetical protein BX600DRAFT_445066 [Xylariales sp. PMI_506]